MDPRYANRRTFEAERWPEHYRIINAMELGQKDNAERATISALEVAYGLAPGAVERALEGGGLEAVTEQASAATALPDPWEQARPRGRPGTMISPELVDEAERRYLPAAKERYAELRAQGVHEPAGEELFPDSPAFAAAFETDRLKGATVYEAAWTACLHRAWMDQRGASARGSRRGSAGA